MQYGLKETILQETVDNLKNNPFSLNIDEAMSKTHKKLLAILVSYFNPSKSAVVVEHLTSIEVISNAWVQIRPGKIDQGQKGTSPC